MFYHIRIDYFDKKLKVNQTLFEYDYSTKEEVLEKIVIPYVARNSFFFSGTSLEAEDCRRLCVYETERDIKNMVDFANQNVQPGIIYVYGNEEVIHSDKYANDITKEIIQIAVKSVEDKKPAEVAQAEMKVDNQPLLFISHASVDTSIILSFIQNVLVLGLGLNKEDIVFTSDETYGIVPGDDIPQYIKRNISGAKVVLIMVSQGYKNSEVSLNEMGAAWALEKNIISVLLPDADFDQLGWVINLKKAVRLDKKKSLSLLTKQIAKLVSVDMTERFTEAATGIDDFLDSLNKEVSSKNAEKQITTSVNPNSNVRPAISYNGENPERVLNDAINKLGEFTIRQLQDETGFKDYHYIAEKVHAMVLSGELEETGPKSHRKYRMIIKSNPLF